MPRKKRQPKLSVPRENIEDIAQRINECQTVISELDNSPTWGILVKDLTEQKRQIDDNWQNMDEDKLNKARILKFATMHILSLKDSYAEELRQRKQEMDVYQNPETNIIKDYDTETNIEG